jgi:hypothetical protein
MHVFPLTAPTSIHAGTATASPLTVRPRLISSFSVTSATTLTCKQKQNKNAAGSAHSFFLLFLLSSVWIRHTLKIVAQQRVGEVTEVNNNSKGILIYIMVQAASLAAHPHRQPTHREHVHSSRPHHPHRGRTTTDSVPSFVFLPWSVMCELTVMFAQLVHTVRLVFEARRRHPKRCDAWRQIFRQ